MLAHRKSLIFALFSFCLALTSETTNGFAQDTFFRGKTIRIVVGFSPGGVSDMYSRIYARQLPKHIPGNPTVVVVNMPGAGGLLAANNLFGITKSDGLTIGMISRTQIAAQLFGDRNVRFDARKLEWVGAPAKEQNVCALKRESGIRSFEDLVSKRTPLTLAATSSSGTDFLAARILQQDLGVPVKIVTGFGGSEEILLATESGELDGTCGISMFSRNTTWSRSIAEQRVILVPLSASLAKSDSARRSFQLLENLASTTFSFALPPGTPRERRDTLRRAFQNAAKDSDFIEAIKKARLDLNPLTGEQIHTSVAQIFETPPMVLANLKGNDGGREPSNGGTSQPKPKPVPPSPLPSAKRGVYWNAWVEREGQLVDSLDNTTPNPHTIYLDMSPYSYESLATFARTVGSTEVDARVKSTLDQHKDLNQVTLLVRAISIGNQVTIANPPGTFQPITAALERLRQPTTAKAKTLESDFLTTITDPKHRDRKHSLHALGQNIRSGIVSFEVTALETGCATIAFSVWLRIRDTVQPLDHVIFQVPVGRFSTKPSICDSGSGIIKLRGGFGTLLSAALSRTEHSQETIDAGVHVFEHGVGRPEASVAVVAVRKEASRGIDVFSWQTDSIISTFIEDQTQLPHHVHLARVAARNDDSDYPYAKVADLMKLKLFSGRTKDNDHQAQEALKALQELVIRKPGARVATRLYSFRDQPLYVPLNLLSAHSRTPVLRNPIVVLQPLPDESSPKNRTCVAKWTFGIPDELSNAERASALIKTFAMDNDRWLQPRLRNLKDAIRFFAEQPVHNRGEGLLLLAHQGHGQLWFEEGQDKLQKEHIKREYPEGSIALLMACSTANQSENNGEILEKLNQRGIQAMVVSPFAVDAEYSAMLAVAFAQEIKAARDQSLLELFERAAKSVTEKLSKTTDPSIQSEMAQEMSREFLILGDYDLKLCSGSEP